MTRALTVRLGLSSLLLLVAAGCGSNLGEMSGEVTYEGQPVGSGMITFLPADGKGPSAGGPIHNGRYAVADLSPGPKVVNIVGVKAVPFARSSEEMAQRAAAAKARGDHSGLIDRADVIPANATGNNATVDVKPGKAAHDFRLTKPAGPAKR